MKLFLTVYLLCVVSVLSAQSIVFPEHLSKTHISKLQNNDSLVYYQCHVDEASQELITTSGQKITSKKKKITITEKFVISKKDSVYNCNYFTSSFNNSPNKKFPYLTLKEVKNWDFELKKNKQLVDQEVLLMAAFETKTHVIVHYELNVNSSCPNEVIIWHKKDKEQFIVEGDHLLSKILGCNN